ncbi:MAG: tetratricopeptide repeat protein [Nitrospirae bacterium]|nr:MAG: tetratricopeptide repeat protein [Nitrospirota bacterium]
MLRLLLTVFLLSVAILLYGYFQELNPGSVSFRTGPTTAFDLSPVSLVLVSMALGALIVTLLVGARETKHMVLNWRSARLRRREEKVEALYREGIHAFLSKRTSEAMELFQKALALDPTHAESLLWLGNIYRSEKNYPEAIRLHRKARSLEERSVEVSLALAKDLEDAKRFEEALQTLQDVLKLDHANVTAWMRKRDLYIRLEKWNDALEIQHRLMKANLSDEDQRAEATLLVGITYEVGRQFLERGRPEKARRYFRGAIKRDKRFLPAYIGLGEILIHEGKTNRLEMVDEAYDLLSTLERPQDQPSDFHKIMANLYLRKQQMELAVEELKKALGFKKRVVVPYRCLRCQQESAEWSGRCRHCGVWNTYVALPWVDRSGSEPLRDSGPAEARSIPYQGIASPFETV